MSVEFIYLKFQKNNKTGFACAAIEKPGKTQQGQTKVTFSFCSPLDSNNFRKDKARNIALSRLDKFDRGKEMGKHKYRAILDYDPTYHDNKKVAADALLALNDVPNWVKWSVKNKSVFLRKSKENISIY